MNLLEFWFANPTPTPANNLPGTYDGPTTGDRILRDTESGQTWIADQTGIWDATSIVDGCAHNGEEMLVTGKKRSNGTTKVYDLWKAEADILEHGDGQLQGRVR